MVEKKYEAVSERTTPHKSFDSAKVRIFCETAKCITEINVSAWQTLSL